MTRRRDSSVGWATRAPEAPLGGASSAGDATRRRALSTATRARRRGGASGVSARWFSAALGWFSAAGLALVPLPASAHAPPLGARVLSSDDGSEVIVTNRGLVFRDASTSQARLLCNEALRINTAELPNVATLAGGALLVAASSGLRLSRDRGCSWSDVGQMETTNTPALAADPNDSSHVVIASYDSDAPGLHVTRDGGASWSLLHATDDADYVHSLLIAGPGALTLYATVTAYAPGVPPAHALLSSHDGGESWQRVALPLTEKDYLAKAAAVSPSDPQTIVLYTIANSPGLDDSRLLVSHDGGSSFTPAFERPEIRGAGYGSDGKLWVAARDGLYGANAELTTFEPVSSASELGCVLERDGALLVCGHYAGLGSDSSGIGISQDGGRSFEPWLDFESVDAPVECPADSVTAALCAQPWRDWELEMAGILPYTTPGGYGPAGAAGATPSATPGSMPAAPSAMPDDDVTAPAPQSERAADEAMDVTCALRPPARSRSGAGGVGLGTLAAGGLTAAWLLRRRLESGA